MTELSLLGDRSL